MIVKVCGLTNRGDTLAAVEYGASAIGLNFYRKSPRYVTPERAGELASLAPKGVLRVGVFVNETAESMLRTARAAGLDVVQLHGDCEIPEGVRVWRAVSVGGGFDSGALERIPAEAVLLDAPAGDQYGGTGKTFDWSLVRELPRKIILAGGLGPDNVAEAIRTVRPWGVDACSRLESAPGKKDLKKMKAFLDRALEAAA